MDDIELYTCPKCGEKGTFHFLTIQLDEEYRMCGKVYKCSACGTRLCITDEPPDVANKNKLT